MKKINFTEIEIAEICALYLSGLTQAKLAKKYSVAQPTIFKLLRKNGVRGNRYFKETCKQGHPMVEPNLYYRKVGPYIQRTCKACSNLTSKNYYENVRKHKTSKP